MKGKNDKYEASQAECNQSRLKRVALFLYDRITAALSLTVAAVIGTAPVVVMIFKQFPLIAPLSNLIITPTVCFVILPLGFFLSFISLGLNLSIMPFHWLIDALIQLTFELIKIFSYVPFGNVRLHNPSVIVIVLFYVSAVLFLRKNSKRRVLPLIIVLLIYFITPIFSKKDLTVAFLDVGQGDAAVVKLPDHKIMLIDGGSAYNDAGRRIIAPYLWSIGVKRVDYLVVSHAHPDHYGGLLYVMDNFPISEVWTGSKLTDRTTDLSRKIRKKQIPLTYLERGSLLEGKGYEIVVLHPYSGYSVSSPRGDYSSENNNSLVLKIQNKNGSVLFTGDIEYEAEMDLLSARKWLNSDVIKVPHHGARTSSSHAFIKAVDPAIAVISAGRQNPFHHPHDETIMRYRSRSVSIVRIDEKGFVQIEFDRNTVNVNKFEDYSFRPRKDFSDELLNFKKLF